MELYWILLMGRRVPVFALGVLCAWYDVRKLGRWV